VSSSEIYENGHVINKSFFDENGNPTSDTTSIDKMASFKGGSKKWNDFLMRQLYFPSQLKIVNADAAIVVVAGTIDEDGNVTNVEVDTPFYPEFDKIAVNAVRKSPKWEPAISHNRKVKFQFKQCVTFQQ
jgi:outer membrane biosynthesis protein TonB